MKRNTGPGLSSELRDFVCTLKRLRHWRGAHAMCLRNLLVLLRGCEGSQDLLLVLGTVGNFCALGKEPRNIVSGFAIIFRWST